MGSCISTTRTPSVELTVVTTTTTTCNTQSDLSTVFDIGALLGQGGFATCYVLRHKTTHKVFAGKIIHKTDFNKFLRSELDIHRRMHHRNVVALYESFETTNNEVVLVLEYCDRFSLAELLLQRGRFSETEICYWGFQLLQGLAYIHHLGIVHRDIKLSNLLVSGSSLTLKIADFGLAFVAHELTPEFMCCGTLDYFAPELMTAQKLKRPYSFEIDVWAYGVCVYILLVCELPFSHKGNRESLLASMMRMTDKDYPMHLSFVCKSLFKQIFIINPRERASLEELKTHKFFSPVQDANGFEKHRAIVQRKCFHGDKENSKEQQN